MARLYGLTAEFTTADELLVAAAKVRDAGYVKTDAYSPFPIHGLGEALGMGRPILAWVIFAGGLVGLSGGFFLAYWVSALEVPYNIGGRPLNSWPSFIPVTFECTVLVAALTAVVGMLAFNGLPRPHHPMFNHYRFDRASQDAFFLTIEAADPKFDSVHTAEFLESLGAKEVAAVEE